MVKGSRKNIEHFEGGIVAELPIRDGDTVTAGDLLVKLDDTQARAELEIIRGQYFALKTREARLQAERDSHPDITFPAAIANSEDPRALDAIQSQRQLFIAARNARVGEIEVLNQKMQQLGEQITGTLALKSGKQKLVKSYEEEIKDFAEFLGRPV